MRTFLALALLTLCGLVLADADDKGKPKVKPLSTQDVVEKLDGKDAKVTTVDVIAPSKLGEGGWDVTTTPRKPFVGTLRVERPPSSV